MYYYVRFILILKQFNSDLYYTIKYTIDNYILSVNW